MAAGRASSSPLSEAAFDARASPLPHPAWIILGGGLGIAIVFIVRRLIARRARRGDGPTGDPARPRAPASPRLRKRLGDCAVRLLIPGALGIAAAPPAPLPPLLLPDGPLRIEGTVRGSPRPRLPPRGGGASIELRARLDAVTVDGRSRRGTIDLILSSDPPLGRGDRIAVEGRAIGPSLVRVPTPSALLHVDRAGTAILDRARRAIRLRFRTTLSRRASAWSCALLLGDRGLLPPSTVARFRRVGQGHLLAISGLHVGLIYALARAIGRRAPGAGTPRGGIILAGLLLLYAGLAGGDPPVVRAAIFAALAIAGSLRGARPRLPELWITSFLLLAAATGAGHDIGFWLSFGAVAAIAVVIERAPEPRREVAFLRSIGRGENGRLHRGGRRFLRALRIATAAWLGATAVLIHATPEIVPGGPLFSLLLAPWLAAMLGGAILSLVPGLGFVVAPILDQWAALGETVVALLDRLPATPGIFPPVPPFAASAMLLTLLALLARAPRVALGLLVIAGGIVVLDPPSHATRLISPDLGRGQGVYLLGESATLLFDAGSVDRSAGGAPALRNVLWREGRSAIDTLFLSHPHADHVLATPGLLAALDVRRVVVGPRFTASPLGAAIIAAVERANVPWTRAAAGTVITIGTFEVEVLHPPRHLPPSMPFTSNDDSLVLHVRGEGVDLLAPGDLEEIGLASVPPPNGIGVLLLPHHGRDAPGLLGWLAAARPALAISCGGTPSAEIQAQIADVGGECRTIPRDLPLRILLGPEPP